MQGMKNVSGLEKQVRDGESKRAPEQGGMKQMREGCGREKAAQERGSAHGFEKRNM